VSAVEGVEDRLVLGCICIASSSLILFFSPLLRCFALLWWIFCRAAELSISDLVCGWRYEDGNLTRQYH